MEYKLGEICTFQEGYVNPSQKVAKYFDGPHKWVRAVDVNNNEIFNTSRTLSEEGFESAKKSAYKFPTNSIVMTKSGTIGRVAIIKDKMAGNRATINIVPNEKNVNLYYLFYLLITKRHDLENLAVGSVQKNLYISVLSNVKINIPELRKQYKIAEILKNIDDIIMSNNKIIANLEEISQTLFKRWFVDFEFPDENGNPYKSSGGEMVDSELGEIPERWEVVKLKDIVYQKKDTFNPKKSNELKVLHFSLPAFDSSQNPVIDDVNAIKSNKWIIDENCILFSKMNPSTRRIWLTSNDGKYLNVASSEFVVLKSDNSYKNAFIYNICTSDKFSEFLNSNTTGSTNSRQRVKPDIAISYKLAFHNETSMLFSNKVEPYLEKIKVIRNENQKLAELRDTLLPKLMSGEIEIPDDIEVNEDELSI